MSTEEIRVTCPACGESTGFGYWADADAVLEVEDWRTTCESCDTSITISGTHPGALTVVAVQRDEYLWGLA